MTKEKDELKKNLEKVAEEQGSQQAISYQDLFNPRFMQKNTHFTTIDVFVRELGVKNFPEIEQLGQKVIDDFVKKETNFNIWEELHQVSISMICWRE
ncbi:hypothetical protein [Lactobacillus helveticus]|uniref:Uncharacterized protein n=1 Tax=Lactobacillus helveticus TaxID=1587 RepID=A0A8H9KHH3_LACHE|nr:hypothetical protein [Lactobacillus helveticus]KRO15442.1 hypothetical protein IV62_GL001786 [Lactobacillus helveticus]MBW8062352.1 hypothetical protein [Lactobacillus helveticus]PXZ21355.1 hypothetical protein DM474_02680 [Lactobacillus helveticus]GFP00083.1 hypothetical protein LHEH8_18380 [Lactobacillus helveticus]GFP02049.1 hypothetical protein LHEW6_18820 [Lactobacillus helveticus]